MFAKEGYPFFIVFALIFIVVLVLPKELTVVVALMLLLLVIWFFRDPERITPQDESAVVSAADGKIVEISEAELYGVRYRKISVFMNLLSVHVNRMPYSGTITDVNHIPGSFLSADKSEASTQNERNEIHIDTSKGHIVAVQVAGLVARRTVSYVQPDDKLSKGERIGMIKFSSRVDHYLPLSAEVAVRFGDSVKAGISTIAHL